MALSLQAKSVIAASGATQLSGFSGDVSLPSMPGNSVAIQGGQGADNSEAAAVTVGSSAFGNITLKPTRFAGAVDISKHLMYSRMVSLMISSAVTWAMPLPPALTSMCWTLWWHD